MSVLLAAGPDEAVRDLEERIPRDAIGIDLGQERLPVNQDNEIAMRLLLERGPAYRAQSSAWPTEAADRDGSDFRIAVLSNSPPAAPQPPAGG